MLVCGADVLESFIRPGVWVEDQVRRILVDHGVVCIARYDIDSDRRQFCCQSWSLSMLVVEPIHWYQQSLMLILCWLATHT